MKKILIILLFLFGILSAIKAQYIPNSAAYSYKGLMPLESLQLPTGCGFPLTSYSSPDSSRAAIYFDSCNDVLYRFNPSPKTWAAIGGGGTGGIDSIFITTTDSIFIISGNDTIFVGIDSSSFPNLGRLIAQYGVNINTPDSTFDPSIPVDVTISADTATIRQFVTQVIEGDTTINNFDTSDITFFVDSIVCSPPPSPVDGDIFLICGAGATGDFAGKENQIVERVGGAWAYTIPQTGDIVAVTNPLTSFYKYNGTTWVFLRRVPSIGGDAIGVIEDLGNLSNRAVTLLTNGIRRLTVTGTGQIRIRDFRNADTAKNYVKVIDEANGELGLGTFRELVAGTGVTITEGPAADTISSTGGGSGSTETWGDISTGSWVNIIDFGGINDSTGGNYAAITAAIAALPQKGGVIYFPTGLYRCDTMITVNKRVTFMGAGCGSYPDSIWNPSTTKIFTTSSTNNLFYVTVTNVKFKDMTIECVATTPTIGAGIYAQQGHGMQVLSCMVTGFYNNIQFVNGGEWTIANSYITGMVNAGVIVRDSITSDDGDESIINCIIAARVRNANYGVYQVSAGGLRLIGNKFNWGYEGTRIGYPYFANFEDTTSNLHIIGNSFENYTENAIYIQPNTNFSGNVNITGNQISNLYNGSNRADIKIKTQIRDISIIGNNFKASNTSDTAIIFDFNVFSIACSNVYDGYTITTVYGTNSVNSIADDFVFAKGTASALTLTNNVTNGAAAFGTTSGASTPTPFSLSLGATYFNSNTPTTAAIKLRLYADGTAANWSGFGVGGSSVFNMFSWAANGWGNITYVNNGTQAYRTFSSGNTLFGTGTTDNGYKLEVEGTARLSRPLATTGNAPGFTLGGGAGVATGATATITGNDMAGYISLVTGSTPIASGDIITVTFSTALTNVPKSIQITAGSVSAANNYVRTYVDQANVTTASWILKNGSVALASGATLVYYYSVIQ